MPETHSVSWVREASSVELADFAVTADEWIDEHRNEKDAYHVEWLARARALRKGALDELVRRDVIEPYTLV